MRNQNWCLKACGVLLVWVAAVILTRAQTGAIGPPTPIFTVLHSFDFTDGAYPYAGLIQGRDGKLYGTTFGGGCGQGDQGEGCGTVFKITTGGKLTSLYTFCSQGGNQCTDGLFPTAALDQGADGKFYGTTSNGGGGYDDDNGTVFNITASGRLTTLYTFCSRGGQYCTDGSQPFAGLVQDADGSLYGTTGRGGANENDDGTVFKITNGGKLTTLYSFCASGYPCTDGIYPSGLILDADGKFYGTTSRAGANRGGTVFSITASGNLATLYSFCAQSGCADGYYPEAGLVQGTDGNFYGTTGGTIFKVTPRGKLTTLYRFCPPNSNKRPCPDGGDPKAALIQGTDGNFYGTTEYGGNNNGKCGPGCGTIFEITPQGDLTTLHEFCSQPNCADGGLPVAGLVQDTNGTFYGTANGGTPGYGVVYSLSVGLGPFIKTEPTSGKVGHAVKILGTDLTATTSVTFNGTAAAFTVKSKSEVITTVPTVATTGPVKVITPMGTLASNVPFRVK
jgi:uncharacterized repeat protein (TIGR03803 family)